ncbi:MAG: hypothetical protein KAW47_01475 [Thermoplasmatales archaeon]|nr:hypothetical protein [Thermoplasmatales archaeon]
MRYCIRCEMPDTRLGSIFDEKGVCQACINYEKRKTIDWEDRRKQLRERAMYNPRSLTKAEWDILCEEAFYVPKRDSTENVKPKLGKK